MFHLFPSSRQEWLRVLVFLFRAYIILAFATVHYFGAHWPRHYSLPAGFAGIYLCYGFSCIVLLVVGVIQLLTDRRTSGHLNIGLALLGLLLGLSFPSFVVA